MKDKIVEESILFVSVFKWIALASAIGTIIGIATALFLKILQASISSVMHYPYYFYFLPLGLFLCSIITMYVAGEAKGYGTEKVIEAVHKQSGKIRAIVIPVKLAATVLTASVGGSVGQIGPCAQIGAGISSFTSDLLRFDETDRKKLVICGLSAGFSAVLGAPIAGAIFGVEVLFVGSILYEVLLPSFIAGIISYHTASFLGINYFHHSLYIASDVPETFFLINVVIGIFFGLCAIFVIEMARVINNIFERIKIWEPLKGIIGGIALVILTSLFSDRCLGLGIETIQETLRGGLIASDTFIMKTVFTAVTFAAGGSGGIIAPIMFIGATAGSFLGDVLGMDRVTIGAIGFVSVLAGAANVPVAMSILAIELFGKGIGAYAAVACVISFLVSGHRSIFPTQIIAMKKSSSVELELGQELNNISTKYKFRPQGLIGRGIKFKDKLRKHEKENNME